MRAARRRRGGGPPRGTWLGMQAAGGVQRVRAVCQDQAGECAVTIVRLVLPSGASAGRARLAHSCAQEDSGAGAWVCFARVRVACWSSCCEHCALCVRCVELRCALCGGAGGDAKRKGCSKSQRNARNRHC